MVLIFAYQSICYPTGGHVAVTRYLTALDWLQDVRNLTISYYSYKEIPLLYTLTALKVERKCYYHSNLMFRLDIWLRTTIPNISGMPEVLGCNRKVGWL